jgi:hypothetical protein
VLAAAENAIKCSTVRANRRAVPAIKSIYELHSNFSLSRYGYCKVPMHVKSTRDVDCVWIGVCVDSWCLYMGRVEVVCSFFSCRLCRFTSTV